VGRNRSRVAHMRKGTTPSQALPWNRSSFNPFGSSARSDSRGIAQCMNNKSSHRIDMTQRAVGIGQGRCEGELVKVDIGSDTETDLPSGGKSVRIRKETRPSDHSLEFQSICSSDKIQRLRLLAR